MATRTLSKWEIARLKKLETDNVTYNKEQEEIVISKGKIHIVLKATFRIENNDDYIMQISGHRIVVENDVIQAIWKALWNTQIATVTPDGKIVEDTITGFESNSSTAEEKSENKTENVPTYKTICFCDVRVHSSPNFLKVQKDEIIPID